MGGWAVTALGVALAIVVIAGAALALCRRYCIGWKWDARNIWNICEEWRRRLSWLWAPREEKVGLVKAQHPLAQTIPGLYRQPGNTSQHLFHSDSDLRLDAQGAFTRFEAVDRDLHPPTGTGNVIPPQPLRPAPQPKSTARPRPSPLQTSHASDYLRMQETGPGPVTPPPVPRALGPRQSGGTPVFVFQNETSMSYNSQCENYNNEHTTARFDSYTNMLNASDDTQTTPYTVSNQQMANSSSGFEPRYKIVENLEERMKEAYLVRINRDAPYRQNDLVEDAAKLRYGISKSQFNDHSVKMNSEEYIKSNPNCLTYDIVTKNQHQTRQHMRNDSRGSFSSFNFANSNGSTAQTIMQSIYGPQAIQKMLQNTQIYNNEVGKKNESAQNIEMTPFRNTNIFQDEFDYENRGNAKIQGLQRVSQYIQSLPDTPIYDAMNNQTHDDHIEDAREITPGENELAQSPVPPPAPPDPPNVMNIHHKNEPTTGERIFSALRSVTTQSYIDASEFYNSVLSSAQQVPMLNFPMRRSSMPLESDSPSDDLHDEVTNFYADGDRERISIDGPPRTSDLYSPELNLEAHRTAQEVYNSLQDPPSSPLLLKDLSQEPYPYMSDPSFTRTSEDIFNSLEQRRRSMERLNGLHDYVEMGNTDTPRRRSSQDLYNALEDVQMKRRLSQTLDDSYGYLNADTTEAILGNRRGSQGPEPEPPPDVTNLKRAISCESVCSDTSVVLGELEEVTIVGLVCVGLEFERWGGRGVDIEGDLAVSILEARDLVAPDGRPAQDTLARVCLLPNRQPHVQTRLYRGTPSPSYQEKFLFPLNGGPIGRTLLVEIFSVESGMGGGAFLLGEASLKLGPAARPPATTWLPLVNSALPGPYVGELLFSLSYLPTAERLTLVVAKARNLHGANTIPGDFFVKVYLLQHGKKMHKKKTSIKRSERSPIFNEAMIFNIPAHSLQTIQLRLTVAELNSDSTTNSKAYSVGHVIIGSTTTGKSLAHWRQMLTALRRPVAVWHPLRK